MKLLIPLALILTLVACTGKTIYVPSQCPIAEPVPPPRDYLAELKPNATPPDFVRACLTTRVDAFRAYNECAVKLKSYQSN